MRRWTDDRDARGGAIAAWLLAPLVTLVLAVAAIPGVFHHRLPDAPPLGQRWIATTPTVARIRALDPDVAALYFDRSGSFVLGGTGTGGSVAGLAWSDEAAFEDDFASGSIPPSVRVVMYDPEGWSWTPRAERRDPVTAMRAFARAARAAGYSVIITPHPNLVGVNGAVCGAAGRETTSAAFLRCGLQAEAARLSDVVEIQAQWLEWDPTAYRAFVESAAAQARRAPPGVVVLAGLSTRFATDAQTLLTAWDAVSDVVDGHYLAVPEGIRPEVAAGFLRALAEQRG
jgi:hypothetical protein